MLLLWYQHLCHLEYKKGENMNIIKDFIKEEDGIGVVEIILILVILIGLVIIFKSQIESLVNRIFSTITSKSQEVGVQ